MNTELDQTYAAIKQALPKGMAYIFMAFDADLNAANPPVHFSSTFPWDLARPILRRIEASDAGKRAEASKLKSLHFVDGPGWSPDGPGKYWTRGRLCYWENGTITDLVGVIWRQMPFEGDAAKDCVDYSAWTPAQRQEARAAAKKKQEAAP